ncbi:MAG: hypothetical protein ACJA2W_000814 [Planctomycetota bacterium]|jgi:hypothetical protein
MTRSTETTYLDSSRIVATIAALERRVGERFPDSSLRNTCGDVLRLAETASVRIEWVKRPIWGLRLLAMLLCTVIAMGLLATLIRFLRAVKTMNVVDSIQVFESGINDMVFIAIAVFFVVSLERRVKRGRILAAIHELRSLAHVIDMHQLTKDPARSFGTGGDTQSSPKRTLTPFELARYLDYCSELLSLVGKVSVLYIQSMDDTPVRESANEVEILTTGLCRQVWQKLMILNSMLIDTGTNRRG